MSIFKKLAGETVLYGISSILARAINYLLVPLYTDLLFGFAREEYGLLRLLYAYTAFFNVIFTYGMETTFFRFAGRLGNERAFRLAQSSILLTTLLLALPLWFLAPALATYMGYTEALLYLRFLVFIMAVDTLMAIPFAHLRQEHRAKRFALLKVLNILFNLAFNLIFLLLFPLVHQFDWFPFLKPLVETIYDPSFGIGYVFLANLLANALTFVLMIPELTRFRWEWQWNFLRPMWRYALPLMLTGLAGMMNLMLDKILIENWLPPGFYPNLSSLEALGVYSACAQLAIFMNLGVQAFKYAAEPLFFAQAEDREAPVLYARVMHYFTLIAILLWIGVSLNLSLLKTLFLRNPAYHTALDVVPILLLAYLFYGIYFNLTVWFKLIDRTEFGMFLTGLGALLTLGCNYWLIPLLGYQGAAWASLITFVGMSAASYFMGQKHFPIPYPVARMLAFIFLGYGCIQLGFTLLPGSIFGDLGVSLIILCIFIGIVLGVERIHPLRFSKITKAEQ